MIVYCLTTGDGPDDIKRFLSRHDFIWQRSVLRLVGEILPAGKEPQHGPTLSSDMFANSSTQHRVTRFQSIEDRTPGYLAVNLKFNIPLDARKCSQVCWQNNENHVSVWTSTESTGGRSRTMGVHVSPPLGDTSTCPPVVPTEMPH